MAKGVMYAKQTRSVEVTLHFESIDTSECVLDCDGGCTNQAQWIAFTDRNDPHHPAIAFCELCLTKLEQYAHGQQSSAQEFEQRAKRLSNTLTTIRNGQVAMRDDLSRWRNSFDGKEGA